MSKKNQTTTKVISGGISQYLTVERVIVGGSILATLIIVGIMALNSWQNRPIDIEGVVRHGSVFQGHEENVNYDTEGYPPAGGLHSSTWQNCGIYDTPIRDENAVHVLEHGGIWITYVPDLPAEDIEVLRNITRGSRQRLLSPYPDQPSPVAVTAWGFQLALDSVNDERLEQFARQYENAETAPEPGALCSGGVGSPLF